MADRETVTPSRLGRRPGRRGDRTAWRQPGPQADPLPPPSIGGEPIDWAERGFDSSLPIGSAQPSAIGTLEGEAGRLGCGVGLRRPRAGPDR